jgi:Ca-activated chloride channel homolog
MKKSYTQPIFSSLVRYTFMLFIFFHFSILHGQEVDGEDQTYSPRFYIPNSDTTLDALPLKSNSAHVTIAGVIADVTIDQVYMNEGTRSIEAKYVFPASTRAAVYYLHMRIGNRLLIADVVEREEAQVMYDSALANGNTVTLLEQMTPNVFQMNVGNILPGDTIEIELRYTELLIPTESVYEFVYPTVVGPRYTGGNGDEWTEGPYQHEGEDPLYDFNIEVKINAGMPISEVNCVSDPDVPVTYNSPEEASIIPLEENNIMGNKDFILQYSLSGSSIETGLLAYEGEEENFFLAMLQPPKHPDLSDIPPREYVFIMDVSGSMNGFPISVSKTLMTDLITNLRPTDRFNIIFFAGGSYLFSSESVEASTENVNAALDAIEDQSGGGGTELLPALLQALSLPGTGEFSRIFMILTDGFVSVELEAFDLIRDNLGEANFFAFGIGSSVNRYIIEGIAHVGQGEPFIATSEADAQEAAALFRSYVNTPVLINISAGFEGFDAYDFEPVTIPDIFAERPVIIYGKYNGTLDGSINIDGITGNSGYSVSLDLGSFQADEENKSLMYLWARKRIQLLEDYESLSYGDDENIINEIISLGLQYNLLTAYTSFIVIDSIVRCDSCTAETVNQPLPMPEGVNDEAIGGYNSVADYGFYVDSPKPAKIGTFINQVFPNPAVDYFAVSIHIDNEASDMAKILQIIDINGIIRDQIDISYLGKGYHTLFLRIKDELKSSSSGNYLISLTVNSLKSQPVVLTIQ